MACKRSAVRSRVAPPDPSLLFIKNNHMSKFIPLVVCVVLLLCTSCSYFNFSSNLDPKNFEEYAQKVNVRVYDKKVLNSLNYVDLGTVEGISCQALENDPKATITEARRIAREEVIKLKGNGIMYSTCIELANTPGCLTSVSCYARALYVKND